MSATSRPIIGTQRAFTLLEIVIVIAILAILAALTIPVLQRSQQRARAVECMGHLRQIGTALVQYLGEHDQTFPTLVLARENKEQDLPALDRELKPYVREPRIFACPADHKHLAETTGTSYLWNHKLNGQRLGALSVTFVRGEPLEAHSRIMVLGDKEGWHESLVNKVNVLYADGHASQELTFVDDTKEAVK